MSKQQLTVFLCADKDCAKAWSRVCGSAPRKWLKRLIKDADLPYKLKVIETECMDRCEEAACLCVVDGDAACWETLVRSRHDADRLLAAFRVCAESGAHAKPL
jgi:hypothetical protein